MRNAFADEITNLSIIDPDIVLLSGDIGNKLFDKFKNSCGDRFFNCGIAEANMMGVAAGMALTGLRPFVYSIAPFTTTRCYEQIRVDVCYHDAPVVIIGTGSGLTYSELGPTHHSCEDLAIMRVLPNMMVFAPADEIDLRKCLRAIVKVKAPAYIRIGKKGEEMVSKIDDSFEIGRSSTVCKGTDVCLISTGTILPVVMQAASLLVNMGISARVENFHTIKPLDEEVLATIFDDYPVVAVVEEHSRIGGLGGGISEWLARQTQRLARLICFGTDDIFLHEVGKQNYARAKCGLTAENIACQVLANYRGQGND